MPPATDGMMLSVSPGFTACLLPIEVADVFVVQVDVDEAAELALVVVEVLLQRLRASTSAGQQLADSGAFDFDDVLLAGEGPQAEWECESLWPWSGLTSQGSGLTDQDGRALLRRTPTDPRCSVQERRSTALAGHHRDDDVGERRPARGRDRTATAAPDGRGANGRSRAARDRPPSAARSACW